MGEEHREHSEHRHHHSHRKHKNGTKIKLGKNAIVAIVLASVLLVALLVFLIVQANSYSLALGFVGLEKEGVHVVAQNCYDMEGNEFRVIQTDSKSGGIGLAIVSKNKWGFWSVTQYRVSNMGLEPHFVDMSWVQPGGVKTFDYGEDTTYEQEWHFVYCGDNAQKLVELKPEQIPGNITVNIQQGGTTYWVHVISFGDEATIRAFDVKSLLEQNGCIPAE